MTSWLNMSEGSWTSLSSVIRLVLRYLEPLSENWNSSLGIRSGSRKRKEIDFSSRPKEGRLLVWLLQPVREHSIKCPNCPCGRESKNDSLRWGRGRGAYSLRRTSPNRSIRVRRHERHQVNLWKSNSKCRRNRRLILLKISLPMS